MRIVALFENDNDYFERSVFLREKNYNLMFLFAFKKLEILFWFSISLFLLLCAPQEREKKNFTKSGLLTSKANSWPNEQLAMNYSLSLSLSLIHSHASYTTYGYATRVMADAAAASYLISTLSRPNGQIQHFGRLLKKKKKMPLTIAQLSTYFVLKMTFFTRRGSELAQIFFSEKYRIWLIGLIFFSLNRPIVRKACKCWWCAAGAYIKTRIDLSLRLTQKKKKELRCDAVLNTALNLSWKTPNRSISQNC